MKTGLPNRTVELLVFAAGLLAMVFAGHGAWVNLDGLLQNVTDQETYIFLALFATLIAGALIVIRQTNNKRSLIIVTGLVVMIGLLLRAWWVFSYDSFQISDFRRYYDCGMYLSGIADGECFGMSARRAVFYTALVGHIFGNSISGLEFTNLAFYSLSSCAFVFFAARIYGLKAAAAGYVFFMLTPDLFFGMTLATHDVPALAWIGVFFVLFHLLQERINNYQPFSRRLVTDILISMSLGAVIFIINLQRGYQIACVLTVVAYLLFSLFKIKSFSRTGKVASAQVSRAVFLFAVVPYLSYQAAASFFDSETFSTEAFVFDNTGQVTSVDILGNDTYWGITKWRFAQYPLLVEAGRKSYSYRKMAHEYLYDLSETIEHTFRKNRVLAGPLGTLSFAGQSRSDVETEKISLSHGMVVETISKDRRQFIEDIALFFTFTVFVLCFVRLYLLPVLPFKESEFPVIVFSGTLFSVFLFLGTVQPRYTFFLAFLSSLWCGQIVSSRLDSGSGASFSSLLLSATKSNISRYVPSSIVLAGLVIASFWVLKTAHIGLEDLSGATSLTRSEARNYSPTANARYQPSTVHADFNRFSIDFQYVTDIAADAYTAGAVKLRYPDEPTTHFEFFLSPIREVWRSRNPYKGTGAVHYSIYLDHVLLTSGPLDDLDETFISHELPVSTGKEWMSLVAVIWSTKPFPEPVNSRNGAISLEYVGFTKLD